MESTANYSASTNTHAGATGAEVLPLWQEQITSLGHWSSICWHRIRVTQKRLVWQLPSCLGAKLRNGMVILLKSSNFCTSREKFHVQIFFFFFLFGIMWIWHMGKLLRAAFGRCPVVPKPWDMFCVCPYSWHLSLPGEDAWPAHDRSGFPALAIL